MCIWGMFECVSVCVVMFECVCGGCLSVYMGDWILSVYV